MEKIWVALALVAGMVLGNNVQAEEKGEPSENVVGMVSYHISRLHKMTTFRDLEEPKVKCYMVQEAWTNNLVMSCVVLEDTDDETLE